MTTPNKEQVYDEQISPLMQQIIEICKSRGIAMIASFFIPTPEHDGLSCTTILPDENGESGPGHPQALGLFRKGFTAFAITTIKGD